MTLFVSFLFLSPFQEGFIGEKFCLIFNTSVQINADFPTDCVWFKKKYNVSSIL